jgi:triosephosphate isomerase (TIM)
MRFPLFIGNWKMHKDPLEAVRFGATFGRDAIALSGFADLALAPQSLALVPLKQALEGFPVALAAQNCGPAESGAFTGESSPKTLKEIGVRYVLLGHSERRWVFGETDAGIALRLKAALSAGLTPVLCVGEKLAERKENRTFEALEIQLQVLGGLDLSRLVLAYEPVWAIGTGETASPAQAQEVHAWIRGELGRRFNGAGDLKILYGGSAKPENAASLMAEPDVDGLLVGGASLDPNGFAELVRNGVGSTT